MTLLDPFEFDPDDERLSRYRDDDLDLDERAALERELRERPELRARLGDLDAAARWLSDGPVDLPTGDGDRLLAAAMAAFDAAPGATRGQTDGDGDGDGDGLGPDRALDAVDGPQAERRTSTGSDAVVVPLASRRRTTRWSPGLIGLSAAALVLIAAVAALARGGSSVDDMAGSEQSAEVAADSVAFEERNVTEALSSKSGADGATSDGGAATADAASPAGDLQLYAAGGELGVYATVDELVATIGRLAGTPALPPTGNVTSTTAASVSTAAAAATSTTAAGATPSTTAPTATAPTATASTATTPIDTTPSAVASPEGEAVCGDPAAGTATVEQRTVRWAVVASDNPTDPRRIVVVDALTCTVLADRPI